MGVHEYAKPGTYRAKVTISDPDTGEIFGEDEVEVEITMTPCFIATAAYGSAMHEEVNTLRALRDQHLMKNTLGRRFVELYYRYSPPVAEYIQDKPNLRRAVRLMLKPLVWVSGRMVG